MSNKLSHGFVLGERVIEPRLGLVITKGEARHLPPRAMALLLLFAEHQGHIVTRDYISAHLWHDESISCGTLSRLISDIRRSLDDDPRDPRFVETVPQQGYRLICSVLAEDDFGDEMYEPNSSNGAEKTGLCAFYRELRQRRVIRAAVMYLLTFWLALQVGELVFQAMSLPDWTLTFLLVIGVLGFPIAVVLAWVLQMTPGGLVLDIAQRQRSSYGRLWLSPGVVLIAALLVVIIFLSGQFFLSG